MTVTHISEIKADIKLCATFIGVETLPVSFSTWSSHLGACARRLRSSVPFCSVEEMFSVRQKLDSVLWLTELKSHIDVRRKFTQVRLFTISLLPSCSCLLGQGISWSLDKKRRRAFLGPLVHQILLLWIFSSGSSLKGSVHHEKVARQNR